MAITIIFKDTYATLICDKWYSYIKQKHTYGYYLKTIKVINTAHAK